MVLVVLNIITGIFVNDAVEMAAMDRDLMSQTEMQKTTSLFAELQALFLEVDLNKSGTLTIEEFEQCMSRLETQAFLSALGLDVSDAAGIFALLDVDGNEELEVEEFVMGCMHIKGVANTVDMQMLMRENKRQMKKWTKVQHRTGQQLAHLEARVMEVLAHFTSRTKSL